MIQATATILLAPAALAFGIVGTPYSQTISASGGGAAPYTYAVTSGDLPVGLSLSGTGTLSGAPMAAGSFTFKITAADGSAAEYTGRQT